MIIKALKLIGTITISMAAAFALLAGGCSSYTLRGQDTKVAVDKVSSNVITVQFCGNAFMSQKDVERYALQRVSEETLLKGFSHFSILEKRDDSEFCLIGAKAIYKPDDEKQAMLRDPNLYLKPNVTIKARCLTGSDAPEGSIDARLYLKENFPDLPELGEPR